MTRLRHGDPITVVLMHAANAAGPTAGGRERGSRLVHTTVFVPMLSPGMMTGEVVGDTFEANEDDRVEHRMEDHCKTWLRGHVPFWTRAAKDLLVHAEYVDALEAEKT